MKEQISQNYKSFTFNKFQNVGQVNNQITDHKKNQTNYLEVNRLKT